MCTTAVSAASTSSAAMHFSLGPDSPTAASQFSGNASGRCRYAPEALGTDELMTQGGAVMASVDRLLRRVIRLLSRDPGHGMDDATVTRKVESILVLDAAAPKGRGV